MSERAKAVVTAWFREQWPGSTNLDPHVDCDYKKLTKHIARALDELERHQAEDAKAIRALESAGKAMHRAVDELLTEFVSKKRAANWGVINDAGVALGKAIKEHAAAIQRAREQGEQHAKE